MRAPTAGHARPTTPRPLASPHALTTAPGTGHAATWACEVPCAVKGAHARASGANAAPWRALTRAGLQMWGVALRRVQRPDLRRAPTERAPRRTTEDSIVTVHVYTQANRPTTFRQPRYGCDGGGLEQSGHRLLGGAGCCFACKGARPKIYSKLIPNAESSESFRAAAKIQWAPLIFCSLLKRLNLAQRCVDLTGLPRAPRCFSLSMPSLPSRSCCAHVASVTQNVVFEACSRSWCPRAHASTPCT